MQAPTTTEAPPVEHAVVAHSDPMIVSERKPAEAPAAAANDSGAKSENGAKGEAKVEAATEKKDEAKKSSLDEQTLYKQVKVVLMHAEVRCPTSGYGRRLSFRSQLKKTTFRSISEQLNLLFGYDFTDPDNKQLLKVHMLEIRHRSPVPMGLHYRVNIPVLQ